MNKLIAMVCAVLSAVCATPAVAQVTLYDQVNLPEQSVTTQNLTFTADSTNTTLNFQGYNVPGTTTLVNLFVVLSGTNPVLGGSNNLLDTVFTYTPAPSNPSASQFQTGIYDTRNLAFGAYTVGSYDTFSQTFATAIGTSYRLGFSLSADAAGTTNTSPNGLRITLGNIAAVGTVPEPSTWAMMLIGFGAVGSAMRRRRRSGMALPQIA